MRRLSKTLLKKEGGWFECQSLELASLELATACLRDEEDPQMQRNYAVQSLAQAIQNAVVQWFDKVRGENGEYF